MRIVVEIPGVLERYAGGRNEVPAEGETVGAVLANLPEDLRSRILNESGEVLPWLRLFRGNDAIDVATRLDDGDRITVLAAAGGG